MIHSIPPSLSSSLLVDFSLLDPTINLISAAVANASVGGEKKLGHAVIQEWGTGLCRGTCDGELVQEVIRTQGNGGKARSAADTQSNSKLHLPTSSSQPPSTLQRH